MPQSGEIKCIRGCLIRGSGYEASINGSQTRPVLASHEPPGFLPHALSADFEERRINEING